MSDGTPRATAVRYVARAGKGQERAEEPLSDDDLHRLTDPERRAGFLADRKAAGRHWYRCDCGILFHVRHPLILARHPGQAMPEGRTDCTLCCLLPYQGGGGDHTNPPIHSTIGLMPDSHQRREPGEDWNVRKRFESWPRSKRHLTQYSLLWQLMDRAGFCALDAPIGEAECWQRLARVLAAHPIDAGSRHRGSEPVIATLGDIAWTPASTTSLAEHAGRVRALWPVKRRAQVWAFCMIDSRLRIENDAAQLALSEDPGSRLSIPGSAVAQPTRATGPYLAFLRFGWDRAGRLVCERAVLQPVAGRDNPMPVESSYERHVALWLQRRRMRAYKPMFDFFPGGLRPDFVILRSAALIEVQGSDDEDYRERKQRIHARMRAHRDYWLVTSEWSPSSDPEKVLAKLNADLYPFRQMRRDGLLGKHRPR